MGGAGTGDRKTIIQRRYKRAEPGAGLFRGRVGEASPRR